MSNHLTGLGDAAEITGRAQMIETFAAGSKPKADWRIGSSSTGSPTTAPRRTTSPAVSAIC